MDNVRVMLGEGETLLERLLDEGIDIGHDCEGWQIDLQGEITALIALGMRSDKKSPSQGSRLGRCVR